MPNEELVVKLLRLKALALERALTAGTQRQRERMKGVAQGITIAISCAKEEDVEHSDLGEGR